MDFSDGYFKNAICSPIGPNGNYLPATLNLPLPVTSSWAPRVTVTAPAGRLRFFHPWNKVANSAPQSQPLKQDTPP
jgi:hypothetical protein